MNREALYDYANKTFPLRTIVAEASAYSDPLEAVHIVVVLRARNARELLTRGKKEAWPVTRGVYGVRTDGVDEDLLTRTEGQYDLRRIAAEVSRGSQQGSGPDQKLLLLQTMRNLAATYAPRVEYRADYAAHSNIYNETLDPSVREHASARLMAICVEAVEHIDASKQFSKTDEESRVERLVTRTILHHEKRQYHQPQVAREAARAGYPPRKEHVALLFDHVWRTYDVERLVGESAKNEDFDYKLFRKVQQTNEPRVREHAEAVLRAICEEAVEYISAMRPYREPDEKKRVRKLVNRTILGCEPNEYRQTRKMREETRAEPRMRYPPRDVHLAFLFSHVWRTYDIEGLLRTATSNAGFDRDLRSAVLNIDTELADRCAAQGSSRTSGCVLL
jgi:hypothetical protein